MKDELIYNAVYDLLQEKVTAFDWKIDKDRNKIIFSNKDNGVASINFSWGLLEALNKIIEILIIVNYHDKNTNEIIFKDEKN